MTEPVAFCCCCPVLRSKGKPHRPDSGQLCASCAQRIRDDLLALPDAYATVDSDPVKGTSEIRSRVFESKPPLNIAALSLLGPGLDTPPSILATWAEDWATYLQQTPPGTTVTESCHWLSARLDWAASNHPAIDEFATDIKRITNQLRAFTGKDRGERVGSCPRQYGDDRCGTPLYVDPYVDQIECQRCHQIWKRKQGEWMHLRAQQLSAGVETMEAA